MLLSSPHTGPLPNGLECPTTAVEAAPASARKAFLVATFQSASAREGIARVAYAEAANQGDSGLAGVVYAILNRLADGRWGNTVDKVLNDRNQFEPVSRVGGDWRNLPAISIVAQTRIDTILNLALDGRLPDLTHGARYFQNPAIVARRANDNEVSARIVNFGGAPPSAIIGAHSFYVASRRRAGVTRPAAIQTETSIFVVGRDQPPTATAAPSAEKDVPVDRRGDPNQALFVGRDGVAQETPR